MIVAIDIRSLLEKTRTGIGYYTYSVVYELIKDTSKVWLLYYNSRRGEIDPEFVRCVEKYSTVKIVHTRYPNKIFNVLVMLGMVKLDTIITKKMGIPSLDWFFFPNLGFISVSSKTKIMLTVHDVAFKRFPHFFSWRRQWWHRMLRPQRLMKRAEIIIVPSHNTKDDIHAMYKIDASKIHTIHHGKVEPIHGDSNSGEMSGIPEKYFLALATIEPRKNFSGLLEAYKESGVYRKGIHLVIVGALGWGDRKILRQFQSTPGVIYVGYVSERVKQTVLSHALALVYPSYYEGFGLPVLEAFAYGIPVITSERSSLPELCNGAAYLIRPQMISDLVHALRDMAGNDSLRAWYGEEGKKRADSFSWVEVGRQVEKLFYTYYGP